MSNADRPKLYAEYAMRCHADVFLWIEKSVGIPSSAVPEFDISNAEYRIVEGWIYKNKHARKTRSCQSNNKVGRSQATGPTRWSYVTDRSNWCPIMWLHDLYE